MGAGISRRSFLRTGAAAGVALNVSFLSSPAGARLVETPPRPGPDWIDPSGRPRYRLDALAKVTGAKTFARDYRAVDLPGWPREQSHAFFIHATKADRSFEGLDLAALGQPPAPGRGGVESRRIIRFRQAPQMAPPKCTHAINRAVDCLLSGSLSDFA